MGEAGLRILQAAAATTVTLGLAVVLGALGSARWLRVARSAWAQAMATRAAAALRAGLALGLAGLLAQAWLEAGAMADPPTPWLPAGDVDLRLLHTHWGHAWLAGLGAWIALAAGCRGSDSASRRMAVIAALAVFILARSVSSHAGAAGDLTIAVALEAVHVALVCVWVGIVSMGSRLGLPGSVSDASDLADLAAWVGRMSATATLALAGILGTGAAKVALGVDAAGGLAAYAGSDLGRTLAVKLGLVALAATLGGVNRLRVLPGLRRSLESGDPDLGIRRAVALRVVLRWELALLIGSLAAASWLGLLPPP